MHALHLPVLVTLTTLYPLSIHSLSSQLLSLQVQSGDVTIVRDCKANGSLSTIGTDDIGRESEER